MLKLKKLQILGFKSFCDRTELKFPGEGIAAVVGPNGCGKSNISDAISWVLGEQSAKSLRGVRMEDVIFAGTRERKATGMAEVSLTLVDPQVYEGRVGSEPELEIQDEMPSSEDDWDEASYRAEAAEATEKPHRRKLTRSKPRLRKKMPKLLKPTAMPWCSRSAVASSSPCILPRVKWWLLDGCSAPGKANTC